ncbi:hypothetical protein ABK040_014769 [Willaertia magna]
MAEQLIEPPTFGSEEMKNQFHIDKDFTNINHGSFGTTPKVVLEQNYKYQILMEQSPDQFYRTTIYNKYNEVTKLLSNLIHSENENSIVLVDNASTAINSIFRSYPFQKTDKIIYFNTAYGMVKKTLEYVKDIYGLELIEVLFDLNDFKKKENILLKIKNTILNNLNEIKMVVMCHISSTPAIKFPLKEIIKFFKDLNIITIVDGAHAIGNIPINVTELNPDYYLSNCHKWLFTPKSNCFLWKNPNTTFHIHPNVISFGYTKCPSTMESFQKEFSWIGTRDYSSFCSIKDAIEYRRWLGGEEKIMSYNLNLSKDVANLYTKLFNTYRLTEDDELIGGGLIDIKLPFSDDLKFWEKVQLICMEKYKFYLVVFEFDKLMFCRISTQIYNNLNDYERVGNIIVKVAQEELNL